jgi:hypothetical protein
VTYIIVCGVIFAAFILTVLFFGTASDDKKNAYRTEQANSILRHQNRMLLAELDRRRYYPVPGDTSPVVLGPFGKPEDIK